MPSGALDGDGERQPAFERSGVIRKQLPGQIGANDDTKSLTVLLNERIQPLLHLRVGGGKSVREIDKEGSRLRG